AYWRPACRDPDDGARGPRWEGDPQPQSSARAAGVAATGPSAAVTDASAGPDGGRGSVAVAPRPPEPEGPSSGAWVVANRPAQSDVAEEAIVAQPPGHRTGRGGAVLPGVVGAGDLVGPGSNPLPIRQLSPELADLGGELGIRGGGLLEARAFTAAVAGGELL